MVDAASPRDLAVGPQAPLVAFKQRQDGAALVSRATYGVSLSHEDPTAELPHEPQSVGRSLWSIVSSLAYLALVAVEVVAFVAIVLVVALVLIPAPSSLTLLPEGEGGERAIHRPARRAPCGR
jgi:hypothetical protein